MDTYRIYDGTDENGIVDTVTPGLFAQEGRCWRMVYANPVGHGTHCMAPVAWVGRWKSILTHNGFHFVVLAAAALVFVSAGLVTIAERNAKGANIHDFGQGLWWAITTVTTVGYGDRYPTTSFGQGVAVFLMLVGIGLIGVLTATIASYFVQERANATDERLDRIEALLTQLVGGGNGAVGEGQTPTDNGLTPPFTPTDSTQTRYGRQR